jgi:hypothetical protein
MKKQYARVVDVLEITEDEKSYNHHRPISGLLLHQLRHLDAAEESLHPKDRTKINISQIHTELEASRYIQKVMKKLHPLGGKKKKAANTARKKARR